MSTQNTQSTLPGTPTGTPKTAVNQEAQRLLELVPRMPEIIVEMWNASMLHRGWQFVDSTIKSTRKVALTALAKEVYSAYTTSEASDEPLKQLLQQHVPRQTATQNAAESASGSGTGTKKPAESASESRSGSGTGAKITLTDPNSSTNQGQPINPAPNPTPNGAFGGVNSTPGPAGSAPGPAPRGALDPVLEVFERNWKMSDDEADNFRSKLGIPVFGGSTSTKSTWAHCFH